MLVLANPLTLESIESVMPEARKRFELLEALDKTDINTLIENLVANEPEIAVAMGALNEEMQLNEFMVKHVSSKGQITRTKDRETRKRQALQTTGLSKSERRRIARKAAKTQRAKPSTKIRKVKKFKKAIDKREKMGLN